MAKLGDLSNDEIYERQVHVERNWHSVGNVYMCVLQSNGHCTLIRRSSSMDRPKKTYVELKGGDMNESMIRTSCLNVNLFASWDA